MLPPLPVDAGEVKRRLDSGERIVFLDARSPDEWDAASRQIHGAIRVAPAEVENHLRVIPQGAPIVAYCDCPGQLCSARAAAALVENGWHDVHPLNGGFDAAVNAGLETEPRDRETALQRDLA
jgi:rhodanese-related sulfurtransferase